jgi:hypothetical protein
MIYGQPLLAAGAAWATLHRYCTTGSAKAGVLAAVMAPLYLGWTVLAGFSVAAGGMPAAVLLLVAAWLTPRGPLMSTTP